MGLPKFKALFILFALLAIIFALLTAILPFAVKKSVMKSTRKDTHLEPSKIDLWGKFPGKLKGSLTHSFTPYDYAGLDENKLPLSNKIIFNEMVEYQNPQTGNAQISVKANREYHQTFVTNDEVLSPSQGFYEYIYTLSHPVSYQKGINSIKYLTESSGVYNIGFEKKLYLIQEQNTLTNEEELKKTILSKITDTNKQKRLIEDKNYGFATLSAVNRWINIAGNEEEIQKGKWLQEKFGLTNEEYESIVGKESELSKHMDVSLKKIAEEYKCGVDYHDCHLAIKQILESNILPLKQYPEIKTIQDVYKKIFPNEVLYDSPEMKTFYETEFKPEEKKKYDDYKLPEKTFTSMIFEENTVNSNCLLDPSNMLLLLNANYSRNIDEVVKKYPNITLDQITFTLDYFINYLPKVFVYFKFENKQKKYNVSALAKTHSLTVQKFIQDTYGKYLSYTTKTPLFSFLLDKMFSAHFDGEDKNDMCSSLLQPIVDDGKKVLKICQNDYFSLERVNLINKWYKLYLCKRPEIGICQKELFDEFKKKGVLSDKEMESIFGKTGTFGQIIDEIQEAMVKHYKCTNQYTCSDEELAMKQYINSEITMNPPEIIKKDKKPSLNDWDNKAFPEALEFYYFQFENQCTEQSCASDDLKYALVSLYNKEENEFRDENRKGIMTRKNLDIITTLYENEITSSEYSSIYGMEDMTQFYKLMQKIMANRVFETKSLQKKYKPIDIVLGNNEEDKKFIDLISKGNYYENHKPTKNKTTGFDMKIAISNSDDQEEFTLCTDNEDNNEKRLRRFIRMNNLPYINVKKEDYSPVDGKLVKVNTPLFNMHPVNGSDWMSDGYEYAMDEEIKEIYYFDELSSRKFRFDYDKSDTYNGVDCRKYVLKDFSQNLEEEGITLNSNHPSVSQKFNKPYVISSENAKFIHEIQKVGGDNFICVDEFTNMVIESNLNLVYSLDTTGGYKDFNSEVEEGLLPVLLYNRHYSVEKKAYEDVFSSVKGYRTGRIVIIVLGIFIIAIFINVAIYCYLKYKKENQEEEKPENEPSVNAEGTGEDVLLPKAFRDSNASA